MDQKFIDLFDRYTHGALQRRAFMERLAALAGGAAAAEVLLSRLQNDYARAEAVAESDARITTETVKIGSQASGYLARPKSEGKFPGLVVIHENRGLNSHIKDVTRRFAVEGFVTLAPDYLSPKGGTPTDMDQAIAMIGELGPGDVVALSRAAVAALKSRPEVNGKVGAVGFCWGGGQVGQLAVAEPGLAAAVIYYGVQPKPDEVEAIQAPLLLHYAGLDQRINAGIKPFEAALKAAGKTYELHVYEGANHAFNNDTNAARYNKEAADLAWARTVEFLKRQTDQQ